MKKTAYNQATYRKFVTKWQEAGTLMEASSKLKIKPRNASVIASFLRRHGVALKLFPRGRSVDYAGLKTLAIKAGK
jgi:hypothetical protein